MKQVSVREFRNHLAKHLKEVSLGVTLELTRNGETIAMITDYKKKTTEIKVLESKPIRQTKPEPFKMPDTWTKKYGKK